MRINVVAYVNCKQALVIDRLIYEEQVKLLLYLNSQFIPSPEVNLFDFYKAWKNKEKDKNYSFESFLNFLLQNRLIMQNVNGYSIAL